MAAESARMTCAPQSHRSDEGNRTLLHRDGRPQVNDNANSNGTGRVPNAFKGERSVCALYRGANDFTTTLDNTTILTPGAGIGQRQSRNHLQDEVS
jgi:hypothetical protein